MPEINAHIIVIDGASKTGKKMFGFELALALAYNQQKTALVLPADSPLRQTLNTRQTQFPLLPQLGIISREDFYNKVNNFNAVILSASPSDSLATTANTFITLLHKNKKDISSFMQNTTYKADLWELKKKIACQQKHALDWIICENNLNGKNSSIPSEELAKIAKMSGFRLAPPINCRKAYATNIAGLSAQDKTISELKKDLTYDDICAKREIIKLAEFIFS